MTPDLLEQGARRIERRMAAMAKASPDTESGGRNASTGRIAKPEGVVDLTHGRILYLEDVSVSFDGFKAINKLSLDIAPGELRCIIGPNGAGKTTMMDIITGKTRPDAGSVFFGSTIDLLRYRESDIAQLGIGRSMLSSSGPITAFALGIAVVLIAPVIEEILYRGYLLGALARHTPRVVAVLMASLCFMLIHAEPANLVASLCLGVATCRRLQS